MGKMASEAPEIRLTRRCREIRYCMEKLLKKTTLLTREQVINRMAKKNKEMAKLRKEVRSIQRRCPHDLTDLTPVIGTCIEICGLCGQEF